MSSYAFALSVTRTALAHQPAPHRLHKLLALKTHLQAELASRAAAAAAPAGTPQEGQAIEVLWCQGGTPSQVRDVWCPATFLCALGSGAQRQYRVRTITPRSTRPVLRLVAPESVRFAVQVAA